MAAIDAITNMRAELDALYSITPEQTNFYADNGYVKLKGVFSSELLEHFGSIISERVAELSANEVSIEQRNTYGKAFCSYEPLDAIGGR